MLGMLESILVGPCRLDKDRPVLVGVSGGADSLCLLSALHEWGWQVIVGQFNHMLREEAEEEAAAVEALAARLDIPFAGGRGARPVAVEAEQLPDRVDAEAAGLHRVADEVTAEEPVVAVDVAFGNHHTAVRSFFEAR